MSPEKQRVAIAEARGYTHVRIIKSIDGSPDIGIGHHPTEPHSVPDYLNDLNAMHDAEKVLFCDKWKWLAYVNNLNEMPSLQDEWLCVSIHAAAAQKAEAFLRTLGLWTETPTQTQ